MKLEPYVFEAKRTSKRLTRSLVIFFVPENRRKPNSRLIELAFVRFKKYGVETRPGRLFTWLAVPAAPASPPRCGSRFPLFMAMREIGDVIAIDQRGTGLPKPNLNCQGKESITRGEKAPNREEVLDLLRKQSRVCAQYWRDQGVDLAGYNTNESADDLDALRKALGAEKISLWAISYGTHWRSLRFASHEKRRIFIARFWPGSKGRRTPSNCPAPFSST